MAPARQKPLFCPDCGGLPAIAGLCYPCYRQRRHSARSFAGLRDQVLRRDGHRCQGCGRGNQRPVHHRKPGIHDQKWLVTVCPACHALIHKLRSHRRWLPNPLLELWQELHPAVPVQLQLAIAATITGSGDQGREAAAW